MHDLTIPSLPEMTELEALRTNDAIKAGITTLRSLLLDMRDRKGWKALGYASFEEYGKTELDYGKTYLHHLANAGEVAVSIGVHNCEQIPESQLRPLAPLTDDERRQVWEEATAKAEADQKKLTAKMVQEAVDRLTAEKADLQSSLDLTEQGKEEWRVQAIAEKKAKAEAEQLAKTAQSESATLRRTISAEAEKLASAKLLEMKGSLESLELDKIELKQKLAQIKKGQSSAIETGTKQALQSQQDELNRKEAQLRAIEGRIAVLNAGLMKVEQQDVVVAHFQAATRDIRATLNTLSHQIMVAIDEEDAPFVPDPFVPAFERLIRELEDGASGMRGYLERVEIRQLEILVNE